MLVQPLSPKVLGARLQAERKVRGLTQQDVANVLRVARTTVVAVEKGDRFLQPEEISALASHWNIPISDLVRDRPAVEPLVPQLRAAAPSLNFTDNDIAGIGVSAKQLQRLAENYLELERMLGRPLMQDYPAPFSTGRMPPLEAAADLAARERSRLGLGDGPVQLLRSVLENEVGLRIFLLPLPSRIAGMFAFNADLGGLIALNIQHPAERRLWTLAHEYYHFLCDRYRADIYVVSGVSPRRANESERLAEVFAAHFLMPTQGLKRRFYELKASRKEGVMVGDLLHLKRQYGVSFQALTFRLEEMNLLRPGTWKSLNERGFREREAEAFAGLPPQETQEERMPQRYIELSVEAFQRAELTEKQLADFLMCDVLDARQKVKEWTRDHDLSEEGTAESWELYLDQPLAEAV